MKTKTLILTLLLAIVAIAADGPAMPTQEDLCRQQGGSSCDVCCGVN